MRRNRSSITLLVLAALLLSSARPAQAGRFSQFFASFFKKNSVEFKLEQPKFSDGISYNRAKVNVDGSMKMVYFRASSSTLSQLTKLFGYSLGFTAVCLMINRGTVDRVETLKFKAPGGYEGEVMFDKNDGDTKVESSDKCSK